VLIGSAFGESSPVVVRSPMLTLDIGTAADDWAAQRMGVVPGETEFIPLPDRRPG
jgi:hypothetical protein